MTAIQAYPRRYCAACGSVVRREFRPGPGGRPNAACPRCVSLERHRFLAVLLDVLRPMLGDIDLVLDVAPSPQVTPLLAGLGARRTVRLDLGADNRLVDVLGSLTELPLADGSVDLLTCYHVLEHVPDDRAAMREITRVLSPGGLGILQVPFRPGTVTDEDPSVTDPAERIRRFGQDDHVRYYGDDFEDRLVEAGLGLRRVTPRSLLGGEMSAWLRLSPDETVWIVRRDPDATVPDRDEPLPTPLTGAMDALLEELATQHRRLVKARAQVEQLRARVAELERGGVVGAARRTARRATGRAVRAARRLGGRDGAGRGVAG
ncbi:class I SAM-dependent methyltransferase [Nocardioides sp. CER19]|uniref:class I SAM-dependent methyltransferase n=1 Tax=Nocardioides sp. CER19 TaxID=3038538 RepID=UPI0024490EC9|nr:class I SAM-dependent methyltransferase [Nocardioides sp. CER19]MDH2416918.1 class I SAM-dependent methyltransferase [Nocardioides sp. CER19]